MTAVRHAWYMALRHLRALWRQPWWIAVTLVQPVIWLLLYGALFKRVVDIPGFQGGSYIEFLAPGVIVMTAFLSAGWSGMPVIEDIDRGVMDRFLISPVRRGALISGRLLQGALVIAIQSVIIVGLAVIVGATFPNGVLGVIGLNAIAALLGSALAALSIGLGLLVRREETLIATVQFLLLPLTFLSTTFMQKALMPGWMQDAAAVNPVNWAVEAGRTAAMGDGTLGPAAVRTLLLVGFLLLCAAFATRQFRSYQRSV